jgi:predicted MPP superfamily phosphohydrolase
MKSIHKNRKTRELEYHGRPYERGTWKWYHFVAKWVFELPLLKRRGQRNAGDVRLNRIELSFKNLPAEFDACRILFIADMHVDGTSGLAESIIRIVERVEYDYCILGGDYSFGFDASDERMRQQVREVVKSLVPKSRVFGILGNHDEYPTAELLNGLGVEMLLNESVCVKKEQDNVYLVGVDDGVFFRAAELAQAGATVPDGAFKIILSHSPDLYKQAAQAGYALYLAGHTHGGQICLPGGMTVVANARVPRKMVKGAWKYKGMVGYTSYGAGTSIAPVRFFCPPEVVLLILTKDGDTE